MAKYRIDEVGYENFSGRMGAVEFKDGVSVSEITPQQVSALGCIVRLVEVESGQTVGATSDFLNVKDIVLPVLERHEDPEQDVVQPAVLEEEVNHIAPKYYTRQYLESVADKDGIAGLRELATKYGIKGISIASLIGELLSVEIAE